jgi:glyoxylase-like metal-dependent hydrolase (beta-lactamase superfamily II)
MLYLLTLLVQFFVLPQPEKPTADHSPLAITRLCDSVFIYTTYNYWNGTAFPSNSMYVVTQAGVVMIDTPWDSTQFQPLLDSIRNRHKKEVVLCIATHSHADRTAGLEFLKEKGVKTYTSKLTYDLCALDGEKQAEFYFTQDTVFWVGGKRIETFYPGEGHTPDNIVVWLDEKKVLYGGCLVKSTENQSLGNVADANIPEWGNTMRRLMEKYPRPKYVIPGHFSWKNRNSLKHTLKLVEGSGKQR